MLEYFNQLLEKAVASLPNVLTAVLIVVISLYVARLVSNLTKRVLTRREADREVTLLLGQLIRWSIIVIGVIAALQRFFDVTAFLAGLGILGFTLGFAMQDIMRNFVAGILLLVQQPFEVDDVIETENFIGTVLAINLRTTDMKTMDGRIVTIPNATILANPITNYTRADRRRIELPVRVSYGSDPTAARQVVLEAIKNVPGYVGDPEPMVVFHTFGSSSIDMSAYFWIDTSKTDPLSANDSAFELVKAALEKNEIEIPFPITMVYLHSES
jgi:small-conductance mechanosensitive channel